MFTRIASGLQHLQVATKSDCILWRMVLGWSVSRTQVGLLKYASQERACIIYVDKSYYSWVYPTHLVSIQISKHLLQEGIKSSRLGKLPIILKACIKNFMDLHNNCYITLSPH